MATMAEHFLEDLRSRLIGPPVSYRRLACDSLLIYVDCEPGDGKGITIWLSRSAFSRAPRRVSWFDAGCEAAD